MQTWISLHSFNYKILISLTINLRLPACGETERGAFHLLFWALWMKTYLDTVFPWILLTPCCPNDRLHLGFVLFAHFFRNLNTWCRTGMRLTIPAMCKVLSQKGVICFLQILWVFGKRVFQQGEICPFWWEESPTKAFNLIRIMFDIKNCGYQS